MVLLIETKNLCGHATYILLLYPTAPFPSIKKIIAMALIVQLRRYDIFFKLTLLLQWRIFNNRPDEGQMKGINMNLRLFSLFDLKKIGKYEMHN